MKPLMWSIRWMSKNKPPWKLIDLAEERRKQTYTRINKALKGLDTLVSERTVSRNDRIDSVHLDSAVCADMVVHLMDEKKRAVIMVEYQKFK